MQSSSCIDNTKIVIIFFGFSKVLNATEAGSDPGSDFSISIEFFKHHFSNCSIAAALNVSAAPTITLLLFFKILHSFR